MTIVSVDRIPNKLFFRIGEVSELLGVEAHVVRYWETEFPALNPKKSASGQRMFRRKDVELLFQIKELLYSKKFTLEGARQALKQRTQPETVEKMASGANKVLPVIRRELTEILKLLA